MVRCYGDDERCRTRTSTVHIVELFRHSVNYSLMHDFRHFIQRFYFTASFMLVMRRRPVFFVVGAIEISYDDESLMASEEHPAEVGLVQWKSHSAYGHVQAFVMGVHDVKRRHTHAH